MRRDNELLRHVHQAICNIRRIRAWRHRMGLYRRERDQYRPHPERHGNRSVIPFPGHKRAPALLANMGDPGVA